MLYAATTIGTAPDCVVIASPFSSLRDMAVRDGMPKWFSAFMPDVWDNVKMVANLKVPLLWIHSRTDATVPLPFGQAVYDADRRAKTAVILTGFNHNAIYEKTPKDIWAPIADFVLHKK